MWIHADLVATGLTVDTSYNTATTKLNTSCALTSDSSQLFRWCNSLQGWTNPNPRLFSALFTGLWLTICCIFSLCNECLWLKMFFFCQFRFRSFNIQQIFIWIWINKGVRGWWNTCWGGTLSLVKHKELWVLCLLIYLSKSVSRRLRFEIRTTEYFRVIFDAHNAST